MRTRGIRFVGKVLAATSIMLTMMGVESGPGAPDRSCRRRLPASERLHLRQSHHEPERRDGIGTGHRDRRPGRSYDGDVYTIDGQRRRHQSSTAS